MKPLLAIVTLTWKAAFRFRVFLVLTVLLIASVVALPVVIKDDQTAQGFTQILLTYTLSVTTALLGMATLWVSCGSLARDIEECQVQMVVVKPVPRWKIWVGKWLGIVSLNAVLLAISGAAIFFLLQWRAGKLPADQQTVLRREIFVARASLKPKPPDIEEATRRLLQDRLKKVQVPPDQVPVVEKQIRERLKGQLEVVPPGQGRLWYIPTGIRARDLRDKPLAIRVKFYSPDFSLTGNVRTQWQVGDPESGRFWQGEQSFPAEAFYEFEVPANLLDKQGRIVVLVGNPSGSELYFPVSDGIEVLFRTGGFGPNFVRGIGIIWCWLALLAALGLTAATFLSFPVASLVSLSFLIMVFFSGTMSQAVQEGVTLLPNEETGQAVELWIDRFTIPLFAGILKVIQPVEAFSPIDALSSGRLVSWGDLGLAFAEIIGLLGGILALIGIWVFSRRELAGGQGA